MVSVISSTIITPGGPGGPGGGIVGRHDETSGMNVKRRKLIRNVKTEGHGLSQFSAEYVNSGLFLESYGFNCGPSVFHLELIVCLAQSSKWQL